MTAPLTQVGPTAQIWPRVEVPALPALVVGTVHHRRRRPISHGFTHAAYSWLVDLDAPRQLPWWLAPVSRIQGEDHLAGEAGLKALKQNAIRVLAREVSGTDEVDRVLLLTNARVLGHVFDPISVYWCLTADDRLIGVVLEVHNTYGERHAYAIAGADVGAAQLEKAFYVSPFNTVDGRYRVRVELGAQRVVVSVALSDADGPLLNASSVGVPVAASTRAVAAAVLRYPLMTQRVTALIRAHGVWLWLRRLPVRSRPAHGREWVA